ncbi:MAG: trypsin-like peptidase domain-containing protein [Phycisphaeraceae bacterium]|nr:MAG: trypsin-like peptidase domain-containing protein [Phycisphaeraceae bacterium]
MHRTGVVRGVLVAGIALGLTGIGALAIHSSGGLGVSGPGAVSTERGAEKPAWGVEHSPSASEPEAEADIAVARSLSRAFQRVARRVEPSVVHIESFRRVPEYERQSPFRVRPTGRFRLERSQIGSGAIVDPSGLIVTNNHVVQGADAWNVRLSDGREFKGELVGRDPLTDVAVLRVPGASLPALAFADSDRVDVGEFVVAVGSPFGFANTVTTGIVSAKGRSDVPLPGMDENAYQDFLQTDAAINPGNSGGPLVDLDGRIVGVNTAIASRAGGSEGIGFAVPANMARAVIDSLVKQGAVVRGWMGVSLEDLTAPIADSLGLAPGSGVLVSGVTADSPAATAGLRERDVVVRYEGRPMRARSTLRAAIALTPPGTKVRVSIVRDGTPRDVVVELADHAEITGVYRLTDVGLVLRNLTAEDARRLGYRNLEGVLVVGVERGGTAERAGLAVGDIITQAAGAPVANARTFSRLVREGDLASGVPLGVVRGEERGRIDLKR